MLGLVRSAHVSIAQSIRCLLLPTTAESYVEKDVRAFLGVVTELWKLTILQEEYNSKNVFKIQSLRDNLEILDGLISENKHERSLILRQMKMGGRSCEDAFPIPRMQIPAIAPRTASFSSEDTAVLVDEPQSIWDENENSLATALYRNLKERRLFQSYARELEESIANYQYLVKTQATADATGHRELRDWAQKMLATFDFLTTLLISISTVGAGLVYATIFSASRGNVVFMCLTFPLFTAGFLVPMTVQVLLRLAANLPYPVQFASQKIWGYILGHGISISGIAIFAFSFSVALVAFAAFVVFFIVRWRVSKVRSEREIHVSEASNALENFKHV
ncbi:hypothetical protein CVT26_015784 [Gymnopilus dilepis]|uniref:Uncharacterized protein n=1 Tax=Gymnopilus dilepis TaxID=231916 RepID=A0A409WMB4_9AGAR|nr:hypothetical protein CVT26_015784 [Gymnopilus dilepis]